jgi:CelD/BcsL family acetyltransferase involved in cellulose biosynthesis
MYSVQPASAVVRVLADVAARQPDNAWDGHPGASYAWARAAAQTAPNHLWTVLGDHAEPVALLSMHGRVPSPLLYPVGHHHGGFQCLNGQNPEATADVLARITRLYAAYLPFCSSNLAFAVKARTAAVRIREHCVAPIVHHENPDKYLASRPRKLRATIRRAEQALAEAGGSIDLISSADVAAVLPHLAMIESSGHRTSGHILTGRHADFLRMALQELHGDGALELWVARIAHAYVGYLVAIRSPQSTYFYTMGITQEMSALSLGSAIFYRAIAYNLAQERWVNLGTGGTLFKSRFATGEQQLYDVLLVPSYALGARQLVDAMPATKHGGRWQ